MLHLNKLSFDYLYYKLFLEKTSPFDYREAWVNKPTRDYLKNIIGENKTVLEFGGGASTLYFSDTCKSVDTIETNKEFIKKIKSGLKKRNVCFYNKTPNKRYDIILVDSSNDRVKEFEIAKTLLKDNGVIVFDNIDRFEVDSPDYLLIGYSRQLAGMTYTGVFTNA